jgi:hypothetical protein
MPDPVTGFKGPANLAKKLSSERVLHFKDGASSYAYAKKYSRKPLSQAVTDALLHDGQNIALMETFGTNPKMMFERLLEETLGNPDDENRNGYGVSLEDGKLVIGGKAMGVTTRVDDYDPSVQWVAVGGFVDVRATRIDGSTGYLDQDGRMYATKKMPKFSRGRLGIVLEVLTPPKYRTYMYRRNVCEEEGKVRVLLW